MDSDNNQIVDLDQREDKWYRVKAGMFLASVTGCSILAGFGLTVGMAKKSDPSNFAKGLVGSKELPESGAALATRALTRASLYSVTGFGLVCFAVWKMMGVHSMVEFREKVGNALPRLKVKESTGRNEFATIRDLFEYIIAEDTKAKDLKMEKEQIISDSSSSL